MVVMCAVHITAVSWYFWSFIQALLEEFSSEASMWCWMQETNALWPEVRPFTWS